MKKINIAELLRNCPKGMELDCTMFKNVTFEEVVTEIDRDSGNEDISIVLLTHYSDGMADEITLTEYGTYTYGETAKCIIFPKGKTTWEGFIPPCKFKVGDRIKEKEGDYSSGVITNIDPDYFYKVEYEEGGVSYINIKFQDKWELVPNKFDINTLKPFDRVLVRDTNGQTMKEIHFYKDTFGMSDFCYESALKTHSATVRAIQNGWDTIYTYAISTLDFSWLLDKGYKIFLHENGKCGEVHEGTTELTDKELSKHHDIRRIWIGGGFEDFFYSKDE